MLNFTHHILCGSDRAAEVNQYSKQMLDELEKEYPVVFSKPMYPIWEYRQLF